ncbi:MAG: DUF935 family protein, partial [Pontimonas sp.]
MPRNAPHTEATKRKISETRKKQEAVKKAALSQKLAKVPIKDAISQVTRRDGRGGRYRNITLSRVNSALVSTDSGRLKDWIEFTETMLADDPHLLGLVNVRKNMVAGSELYVEPDSDDELAKAAADFVRQSLDAIPRFRKALKALLDGPFSGIGLNEIMWTQVGQNTLIEALKPLSPKKFKFNEDLELCVDDPENQEHNGKKLSDFRSKFVTHLPGVLTPYYPNKDGLLRAVSWYWAFKKQGIGYWLSGAERFAFPAIVATVPENTAETIVTGLRQMLAQLSTDQGIVLQEGVNLDTLNQGTVSGGDAVWHNLEKYFDAQMTKLISGGTLNTDQGDKGSHSLGEVHERTRLDIAIDDAEALAETLKSDLVIPLLQLNTHRFGGVMPPIPRLWFDIREYKPIEQWHVGLGVIKNNQVLEELGLPRMPKDKGGEDIAAFISQEGTQQVESSPDLETPEEAPNAEKIQDTALNGAQVQSLQSLITDVATGILPAESAIEVIIR